MESCCFRYSSFNDVLGSFEVKTVWKNCVKNVKKNQFSVYFQLTNKVNLFSLDFLDTSCFSSRNIYKFFGAFINFHQLHGKISLSVGFYHHGNVFEILFFQPIFSVWIIEFGLWRILKLFLRLQSPFFTLFANFCSRWTFDELSSNSNGLQTSQNCLTICLNSLSNSFFQPKQFFFQYFFSRAFVLIRVARQSHQCSQYFFKISWKSRFKFL